MNTMNKNIPDVGYHYELILKYQGLEPDEITSESELNDVWGRAICEDEWIEVQIRLCGI